MKLTATYNGPLAAVRVGEAVEALTGLGFSDVRITGGDRAAPCHNLSDDEVEDKFDTIVCPGGANGVLKRFFEKKEWRWVKMSPRKVDSIKYLAIYETLLDAENSNARGGRGQVVGYAPVRNYKVGSEGKYWFKLGDIEPLAIPSGNSTHRNIRYTKCEDLLHTARHGMTLEDLFKPHTRSQGAARLIQIHR
jgi:hypothetical protein